ncbi:MFS transporter [Microbacterium sp. A196]|uniref:MFS transporter n=1 Tax=Microbacterium sp. A196 TaxID=3457320 RepID=UPI003FD04CBC
MSPRRKSVAPAAVAAFLGILFVGLSLRTVITSISPLLEVVSVEVPLDGLTLGIIAAVPTLAYALSGVITPEVARRIGLERTVTLVLLVMVLGHAVRAVATEPVWLLMATVVTLLASGVGNVLVPPLIKRHFPQQIGVVTAVYVASLAISSAVPALVAVPMAELIGWRAALGVWGVATAIALLPWLVELRVSRRRPEGGEAFAEAGLGRTVSHESVDGQISKSWIAWSLVGLFAMCSFGGFAMLAWMPTILVETAGVDPAAAGSLLSLFAVCGFPIAVLVPPIVARMPSAIVPIIVVGMASFIVGYSGLLIAPRAAPILWVLALGVGSLPYPLAFTLIGLRTRSAAVALRLSGFVQAVGYVLAAVGPFAVGILHELTGTWAVPLGFLMAAVLLALPAVFVLGRPGFVEDEIRRSTSP